MISILKILYFFFNYIQTLKKQKLIIRTYIRNNFAGKFACISENAITFLEKQTKSECSEERLYAFKALTNISEATQGREELQNFAKNIEFDAKLKEIENRAKSVAKQVIEWKPQFYIYDQSIVFVIHVVMYMYYVYFRYSNDHEFFQNLL